MYEGSPRFEPQPGHRLSTQVLSSCFVTPPMKMEQSAPKRRHVKFMRRGITKKENIQLSENDENLKSRPKHVGDYQYAIKIHFHKCIRLFIFIYLFIPGGKGSRCVRLTTLPPSGAVVMKSGNLDFLEPSGPLQACNGTCSARVWIVLNLTKPLFDIWYSLYRRR